MPVSSLRTSTKGAPRLAPPVVLPAASRHFAQRFSGGITPALTTHDHGRGRWPGLVRGPALSGAGRRPRRPTSRRLVPVLGAHATRDLRPPGRRDPGRLGGDVRPQPVDDGQADVQQPPAQGGDGRLLVEPSARAPDGRRCDVLPGVVRHHDPHLRVDPVRLAAPALDRAPCDGPVPRQRGLHQGRAQREPGTGAARAAHRRHRRRLQRARREAVRQDAHRLPRRPVVALVPAVLRPHRPPHGLPEDHGPQLGQCVRRRSGGDARPT